QGTTGKTVEIIAVSLGGGSFEIRSVNGFLVKLNGDQYGLMVFTAGKPDCSDELKTRVPPGVDFSVDQQGDRIKYEFKSSYPFPPDLMSHVQNHPVLDDIAVINPVMPVIAGRESEMPFSSISSLMDYAGE